MTRKTALACLTAATLVTTSAERAVAAQRLVDVRQVATDTLHDLAVATYERGQPVIYFNPTLLQRVGPLLSDFFLAHEYGHIAYGHAGGALAEPRDELSSLRQRQELEADCYATRLLADRNPAAVDAALQFFARMGPFRFDDLHPSGSQRAAKVLACLPSRDSSAVSTRRNPGLPNQ